MSPARLDPREGRNLYGSDPAGYALGRPQYPERVYDVLTLRCGLSSGARVVEIGPGTGLATRRLLEFGARVAAVEPNDAMARHLGRTIADPCLEVVAKAFEDSDLAANAFDLAVAATSFHWVDQQRGLAQLRRILRRGGSVAIWWMLFEDPSAPDALTNLVEDLLGKPPGSAEMAGQMPFQLDTTARCSELEGAGFIDVESEVIESVIELDAPRARALYGSMAVVLRRSPDEQRRVLDAVEAMVRDRFEGNLRRRVVTSLYTARNP